MPSVHLGQKAYAKIVLHAAKYSVVSVAGLLLGTKDGAGHLTVDDAVPLFHNVLPLSPMLEVALQQVDVYCKQTDCSIVGYYFAHELLTDTSITPFTAKVASKIDDALGGDSLLLVINNKELSSDKVAVLPYSLESGSWKVQPSSSLDVSDIAVKKVGELVKHKAYEKLVDFDNHLDDIKCNWLNPAVNQLLAT
ncbi:hypothetical protein BJ742DRAFT_773113 [Cladochytrium replicatum]|nr:hypothetical protein BJ742DRAFT_773113 [Cladochytrium replicatum]